MTLNLSNLGFKTFLERLHKSLDPAITPEALAVLWLGNDKARTPGATGYGTAVKTLTAMAEMANAHEAQLDALRREVAELRLGPFGGTAGS